MTAEETRVQNTCMWSMLLAIEKKSKTMHVKANMKFLRDSRNSYCHSTISWREMQMRACLRC